MAERCILGLNEFPAAIDKELITLQGIGCAFWIISAYRVLKSASFSELTYSERG